MRSEDVGLVVIARARSDQRPRLAIDVDDITNFEIGVWSVGAAAVAENDIVRPTAVCVLGPAADGAGIVSSRGAHDS